MGIFWNLSGKGAEWWEKNNLCRRGEKKKHPYMEKVRNGTKGL
jgi:hypothetical protein